MHQMESKDIKINIYDLNYPCYLAGVPEAGQRIVHIPGEFEYKYLEGVKSHVLEGYQTKDKLYLFDIIPLHLWKKCICKISYEKRLKALRAVVNSQITNYNKVIDLNSILVDNPYEFSEYCDNLLTQGYKRVRIMDVDGNYVFGESTEGEFMEYFLEEKINGKADI